MRFRAFVVATRTGIRAGRVEEIDDADLPPGQLLVRVDVAAVNYKDAMVTVPGNRVARVTPLVPGVDLAGTVIESDDGAFPVGAPVIAHGADLGIARHGAFAEFARLESAGVVPLPPGYGPRDAMAVGTAGLTALLSLRALEGAGVTPASGPVLVTGAVGGVGSMAVLLLARTGYTVVASTGRAAERDYLRGLGATEVIGRETLRVDEERVLGPERFAGAVDCVGGETLAAVLRTISYGGAVAASGLTGGSDLATTVYPFIVRGVSLVGVDTVHLPIAQRRAAWAGMRDYFPPAVTEGIIENMVGLDDLDETLARILRGAVRGRVLVDPRQRADTPVE